MLHLVHRCGSASREYKAGMRARSALARVAAHVRPSRGYVRPMAMSTFAKVPMGPPDPIFGLTDAFNKVSDWWLLLLASVQE